MSFLEKESLVQCLRAEIWSQAAGIYVQTLPQTNRVIMIQGNGPWFLSYKTVGNNLSNVGGNACKLNFCCF